MYIERETERETSWWDQVQGACTRSFVCVCVRACSFICTSSCVPAFPRSCIPGFLVSNLKRPKLPPK